ncbi:putative xylosidase/arabinosidase [Clohesyomyces aquaticus]|uniref:Putative xylosidase/arabinosidase n=1 Tax=Clohesyomyces aquaticus TaxID=1231657 RepID=A0A1Y1ZAS6_9PLEO|nr:putative xylosidase/arabinosidase [Clohesyomyces aquaticus]
MFPGLPIYASQDLVHWKQIGNGLYSPSQLSLKKSCTNLHPQTSGAIMLATGGTPGAAGISQNFIISCQDIYAGNWSDPVYFDFQGIDPSLFFSDDGKAYICGSAGPGPMTKIHLFEVDIKTGEKLTDEKKIWDGTGGIYPEGPHIYVKDGWYYLVISERGTHEDHMITMARAKSIWGPYEECPKNPILTARGTGEYVQYTGHCEAFQDVEGGWWGVCLGVRKYGEGRFVMGRETFLTSGRWEEGGWLELDLVKINPEAIVKKDDDVAKLIAADGLDYLYIRDVELQRYKFSQRFQHPEFSDNWKAVTLTTSSTDLSHPESSPTFVGKRRRILTGTSSVTLRAKELSTHPKVKAGLAIYKDEHRYLRIFYDTSDQALVVELINNAKNISQSSKVAIEITGDIELRIEYMEKDYQLVYRHGNGKAETLPRRDTLEMTGPDFVGPVIGVFAVSEGDDVQVDFSDLSIT